MEESSVKDLQEESRMLTESHVLSCCGIQSIYIVFAHGNPNGFRVNQFSGQVGYATLEVAATYSLAIADASPRPFVCQCCLVVVARGLERGVVIKHKK
jgi:hypothetical protein